MRQSMLRPTTATLLASMVTLVMVAGCSSALARAPIQETSVVGATVASSQLWNGGYADRVQPIFDRQCVFCHGQASTMGGLKLTSYEGVMRGKALSTVVIPGSSARSTLVSALAGAAGANGAATREGHRLSEGDLREITLWIDAGACPD